MKKSVKAVGLLLAAFMLGGCANTDPENIVSGNPFENTQPSGADDYEEAFGKYQSGGLKYSNFSISADEAIEYNGGNIELSFDSSSSGNKYDVEIGYMAFINGIPQKLSLNGGESSELVCISQAPDQSQTVTLSILPAVPEELSGENRLQLKLVRIFNPSFKPSGNYKSFGNAHSGQAFWERDIKVNSPLEVSESMTAVTKYESLPITDEISSMYKLGNLRKDAPTAVAIKDFDSNEQPVLRNGRLKINLLMYGTEQYNYNVYLYLNHCRIKFNGYDYLSAKVKSGYLNVFETELEGLKERDFIYAVAVPVDSETGSMNTRKSDSLLILDESGKTDTDSDGTGDITVDVPEFNGSEENNIYLYNPVGYIDNDNRYLLLTKRSYLDGTGAFHDYIMYDGVKEAVIGVLDAPGEFHSMTYGDGVVTLGIYEDENKLKIVVYNEKLEAIKKFYEDELPENYYQKYDPINDCFYFSGDSGFCRADGDFSEITVLDDFTLNGNYFILDDKIIYYRKVYDYQSPADNADIFGIMELDGTVISETKASPYGTGHFRIGRAGDYIYFMSPLYTYTVGLIEEPMDGIILYNIKTGEQKTMRFDSSDENSYCFISPDGKHIVTGTLVLGDNGRDVNDTVINIYDTENGRLLKSESLGGDKFNCTVYNDQALFGEYGDVKIKF